MADCDLCGCSTSRDVFRKEEWQLVACDECGLVRVDPRPEAQQIAAMYAPTAGYQLQRLASSSRYSRWEERRCEVLARITGPARQAPARLLDVGCSTGGYLERARAQGWSVQGIELAKHLAVYARTKRGLPVEHGSVDDVLERFGEQAFDVITLWDVIEHLPQPLRAMRDLYRALRPGGKVYLATPNLAGWVPRYHWQVVRRLWKIWPHPEPPLHLHQFSRDTMARLLSAARFEDVRFAPDEIPLWYTSGFRGAPRWTEWLNGEMHAPRARRLYLMTLPVFLAARLCGGGDSMIVCASKPVANRG
ncbi:MAG: class I SAM-dependent methyltransferase [Deltaproteobacteria bacterium]|nr:class I SAM-dependent methyltransferase [Deltaproteobacteria bacterium]